MPWTELDHTKRRPIPRRLRVAGPPKVTLYRGGLVKVSAAARRAVAPEGQICLLHDPDQPHLFGLAPTGTHPHRLSKAGTMSAVPLWRHLGEPDATLCVELRSVGDMLIGDITTATPPPPTRVRRNGGRVDESEVAATLTGELVSPRSTEGSVDGATPRPDASAPSDSPPLDTPQTVSDGPGGPEGPEPAPGPDPEDLEVAYAPLDDDSVDDGLEYDAY